MMQKKMNEIMEKRKRGKKREQKNGITMEVEIKRN
jgi:hypothetical protein